MCVTPQSVRNNILFLTECRRKQLTRTESSWLEHPWIPVHKPYWTGVSPGRLLPPRCPLASAAYLNLHTVVKEIQQNQEHTQLPNVFCIVYKLKGKVRAILPSKSDFHELQDLVLWSGTTKQNLCVKLWRLIEAADTLICRHVKEGRQLFQNYKIWPCKPLVLNYLQGKLKDVYYYRY